MPNSFDFLNVARLIADHARAEILLALMANRALPAGELAQRAGITPQTASHHLSLLVAGNLVHVTQRGRHRYYRLAGPLIAQALESLAIAAPAVKTVRRPVYKTDRALVFCRTCYSHLAGKLGVYLTGAMQQRKLITLISDREFLITSVGFSWLKEIGMRPLQRNGILAKPCLDWTERDYHIAGQLGLELMRFMEDKGYLSRISNSRALTLTTAGRAFLTLHFGPIPDD